MDLVVSLGGSVIARAVEDDRLDAYVAALEEMGSRADTMIVVTGAGPLKRYIDATAPFDVSESRKDMIGVAATRLQASSLAAAMDANVSIPASLEELAETAARRETVVLGGLEPGHSTDAVAAMCAEIVEAEKLVLATTVDGVYDSDPAEEGDAMRYDELSHSEMVDLVRRKETSAGSYPLMDLLAAKLVERSRIECRVVDGRDPDVLSSADLETFDGTLIR